MEKRCNLCHEVKALTEFYVASRSPDGHGYTCKSCSRARSKRWNQEHKDRARENDRRSWANRAERINAARRERNATDDEYLARRAERRRQYWAANREENLRKAKEWRESPAGRAWKCEYMERTRERRRARYIERVYGVAAQEYEAMLAAQRGLCAICKHEPKGEWHVDHDHACCSGATSCGACVRGLLCVDCNHGLGRFRDDPAVLSAAVRYLTRHTQNKGD